MLSLQAFLLGGISPRSLMDRMPPSEGGDASSILAEDICCHGDFLPRVGYSVTNILFVVTHKISRPRLTILVCYQDIVAPFESYTQCTQAHCSYA